jgi:hypothetical protein
VQCSSDRLAEWKLWNIGGDTSVSLRLDARELDDLAPLLGFFGHELAEVGWRARKHGAPEIGDPPFRLGVAENGIDLLVQLSITSGGVVFGATIPFQPLVPKPGTKSLIAGISGSAGESTAAVKAVSPNHSIQRRCFASQAETRSTSGWVLSANVCPVGPVGCVSGTTS